MKIRKALGSDLEDILRVEREAFGSDEEAELVRQLIVDENAKPLVSLIAFEKRHGCWSYIIHEDTPKRNRNYSFISDPGTACCNT